ncbi:IS630 family transposase [Micromonospora sp. WMMA1976]|uniref:IS630 family transposase n=1 Tax=Micromonospora sp. WMMA1976 TaxID=3014995 RepID=UPI00248CB895|nr:IS630 family transposase [Micromonospora sp. WMMA1976]WBC03739.1 IS630 family transposase [Micromonospora sp. WMMA1976]WBC04233.1 IS630 family transposase [Micromonospora sp. WMMA1976]
MGRRPEVFVRQVSMAEGQRLQRITRTAKDPVKLRRAIVVLMSAQGQPAPDIAHLLKASEDYVRDVIHAFNERGFDALDPKWNGGAPRRIDEQTRDWICVIARCDPRFLGRPFSCWSLAKLRDYLIDAGYVATISAETIRRILHERGVSWQATKTWKASNDPDFTSKMRRILDLYDHPPADGRVLCVDEFGPLSLQPRPGRAWRPQGQPVRLRATYTRDQGVRHMIAALDLATGRLHYRIRDRKRWREFLSFLKTLRRRWPDQKLYLICDNFSPHKHPEVRAWCAANQVDLVFLPTYASWLNWIEDEFAAVRYFALNGTDHRSHAEQDAAIGDYIRWRNQRARPKSAFAAGSKIRHPDYPFKAA